MLIPISVSRSGLILKVKSNKTFISTTFIAYFGMGREKFLNEKKWVLTSLLKGEDAIFEPIVILLSKENCSLYWKDWSNMPLFGHVKNDFPGLILPEEITKLIKL